SVALALFLENSGNRMRNVQEVRRLAPGPIVGTLPRMTSRQVRRMKDGHTPPVAREIYNLARANLARLTRHSPPEDPWNHQVIMVTSAVPGEGKSLTAAHIARSLARSGKTVVLVDADLRCPMQNRLFDSEAAAGLVDILTRNVPPGDVLEE